jgi:hypothetical protein
LIKVDRVVTRDRRVRDVLAQQSLMLVVETIGPR